MKVLVTLAVAILLFRALDWISRKTDPLPAVPEPNAYVELVQAGSRLSKPAGDLAELSQAQVAELVQKHAAELNTISAMVYSNGAVPIQKGSKWNEARQPDISSLKRAAVFLALKSRVQLTQGQTNAAAVTQSEVVLLGALMGRGGLLVDAINSLAFEMIGVATLRGMVSQLDAETAGRLAKTLESVDQARETPEQILEREQLWANASFGLVSRMAGWFQGSEQRRQKFAERQNQAMARTRRLILALAARAYELEKGAPPQTPGDLVPHFLKALPVDPESRAPFATLPGAS